jgi:DNA-binding transcriptional LysR family regulator
MDQYLLRYFLAVVEAGNFSKAAARANVAQPTLSVGIAKLESRLGAKLFHRTNRRVSLTNAGSRFLIRARRIEHEYNLAIDELSDLGSGRLVRVGFLATIPTPVLEDVVSRHRAGGAGERLEILEGTEREIVNLLDRGRIDLALTILRGGSERPHQEPLYSERYRLIMSRRHRLAAEKTVQAADLSGEAMILRRHCEALSETSRFFTEHNVRPLFAFQSVNDDRALAMVRAGLGVTVMPEGYEDRGIAGPALAGFKLKRQIGLAFADHASELREGPCAFRDAVRQVFGR